MLININDSNKLEENISYHYHGCYQNDIEILVSGHINVSLGGGELGRGFYTTPDLHVAKRWAATKKRESTTVLEIAISDRHFFALDLLILDREETDAYHERIKKRGQTRTFLFHKDIILAPLVGDKIRDDFLQIKWESKRAEQLINSHWVKRRRV